MQWCQQAVRQNYWRWVEGASFRGRSVWASGNRVTAIILIANDPKSRLRDSFRLDVCFLNSSLGREEAPLFIDIRTVAALVFLTNLDVRGERAAFSLLQ